MSESMIERVARKMVAACDDQGEYTDGQYGLDGVVLDGSFDLLKVARAAIEAMREPTKEMIEAGQVEYAGESFGEDCNLCLSTYVAEMAWQAMIDAAFEESA